MNTTPRARPSAALLALLALVPLWTLACGSPPAADMPAPRPATATTGPDGTFAPSPEAQRLTAYLDSIYPADEPGAAVLVERGGETLLRDAFGMAELELGVPLEPEHVFRLGSITKQFTSVGILMLAEEGSLSLDDEITRFLPGYPTEGHRITVEDLLHHTAGIRSYTAMPEWRVRMRDDLEPDSLIAIFRDQPLDFEPRSEWEYSNSGYALLGKVIEVASGQSYQEFIRNRIFEPLGMDDSYYGDPSRIIPGRAEGYERTDDGWRNDDYLSMTSPYSAGALLSTVDDLDRWYDALEAGDVVHPALLVRAYTPARLTDGRSTGYGFGWTIGDLAGRTTIEHGGGINGFLTHALRVPDEQLLVIVLTNRVAPPGPSTVAVRLAELALGEPEGPAVVELGEAQLRDYVGVYRINEHERREVTLEDGALHSQRTGGERYRIEPIGDDTFRFDTGTRARFVRTAAGDVVSMVMIPRAGPEEIAHLTEEVPGAEPETIELPRAVLERYTGEYAFSPQVTLSVRLGDDGLVAVLTGQPTVTLLAESETRFRVAEVPAWVEFEVDDSGLATAATIFQGGQQMRAPRIDP